MRLSHLEIVGFKSFSSRLGLKLSDGITAVVGPNGCGKSNIVDAIRWVLGEQRATALRGDRMEDIIFNGTASRKPLGMAEVSLTIDNKEQLLPIEYSEVTITRRYFRSGDSEYQLNKVPCRLKDITDLLLDTGMGTHAYSIIEQGMVDAIVNGSPMDRRQLLEEAAGINKYKTRRRLARRKLESTEQDLVRIADILEEVERNASALRRQVWKVERYNRLTQDQKDVELACAYHEYMAVRQNTEPIRTKIEALLKEKEQLVTQISSAESRVQTRLLELTEKEQTLNARQQEVNSCDQQINALNEKVAVDRTKRANLEQRMEVSARESQTLRIELAQISEQLELAENELSGLAGKLEMAERLSQTKEKESTAFARTVAEGKEKARVMQRRRYEMIQQQTETRGQVNTIDARLSELGKRQAQLQQARETVTDELAIAERQSADARKALSEASQTLDENLALKVVLDNDIQTRQQRREESRNRKAELDTQLATRESEHGLLVQMRQRYEGYGKGVRALMAEGPNIEGLRGTLAEEMTVDAPYASAVEAYLGEALQFIIASSTEAARSGIEYLRGAEEGKASFLLLDRLNGRDTPPQLPYAGPEVIGSPLQFVKVSKALQPAVQHLLGRVVLVNDLDAALRVASEFNDDSGWELLTPDGLIVDPVGVLTGGVGGDDDTNLLSRTARIEVLETELASFTEERDALEEEIAAIAEALNGLLQKRSALDQLLEETQRSKSSMENNVSQLAYQVKQLTEQKTTIEGDATGIDQQIVSARAQLEKLKSTLSELERNREDAEDSDREAQETLDELEARGRRLAESSQEARVALVALEGRGNELRTTTEHLRQRSDGHTKMLDQRQTELTGATGQVAELKSLLEVGEADYKVLYAERRKKEAARDEVATEYRSLGDENKTAQFTIQETRKTLEKVQEQIHKEELQDAELYTRSNEIRKSLIQQFETDPENIEEIPVVPGMDVFDMDKARTMVTDIQRRIEALGALNLAAIEEYNAAKERLDFLTQQRDDLIEAKENLDKTIARMNRAARARFLDTFEEVRRNFMTTFEALFEGGEADLRLQEGDPLEAGIEIMARPRGKTLQSIALLSGGETALTATALLFAIYLYKPSPFCIFDEVDAPLDEANVRRFAAAVRQFAADTQFLIVTHNKRTMEAADYLYGVTMEEPGMSKMVSVRLEGEHEDDLKPAPTTNELGEPVRES
jgi:chromosome segregation protein